MELKSYELDRAAQEFANSLINSILKEEEKIKEPIYRILFFLQQTAVTPWEAWLYFEKSDREITYDMMPRGLADMKMACTHSLQGIIPYTIDDKDLLKKKFIADYSTGRHFSFSRFRFPGVLYYYELYLALKDSLIQLTEKGIIHPGAYIAFLDEDEYLFRTDQNKQKNKIDFIRFTLKDENGLLAKEEALNGLIKLCYLDKGKQQWLTELIDSCK